MLPSTFKSSKSPLTSSDICRLMFKMCSAPLVASTREGQLFNLLYTGSYGTLNIDFVEGRMLPVEPLWPLLLPICLILVCNCSEVTNNISV